MADDFHGSEEQAYFEKTMKMVFPDRPIVDIPNNDPIFHTVFDLDNRYRITGAEHLGTGYKKDGKVARWEGIYDDKGRIMVAISLNSDIGDSWEWSDTSGISAAIFRPRDAPGGELRRLCDDPLTMQYQCPIDALPVCSYYNSLFCYSRIIANSVKPAILINKRRFSAEHFHRFFRGRDSMKWNEESCR